MQTVTEHLQATVYMLEARKRTIGRHVARSSNAAERERNRKAYNEVEQQIRYLVENFKLERRTKPYVMED